MYYIDYVNLIFIYVLKKQNILIEKVMMFIIFIKGVDFIYFYYVYFLYFYYMC